MNAAGLIILFSLITFSFGLPIVQEDSQMELLPEKVAEAYFLLTNRSITYRFDFSPVTQVADLLGVIRFNCSKYPLASQALYHQILDVDLWADKRTGQAQVDSSGTSSDLEQIGINIDKFIKHTGTSKCKLLPNITRSFHNLNNEMIALTRRNFSSFHNLISREQFHYDVKRIIYDQNINSSTLPFDFEKNFSNFVELAGVKIESYGNSLYLTFQIPAFSKQKRSIYRVYPKPIVFRGTPYILKPNYTLLINKANESVLLPVDAMERFCREIMQEKFCDFPVLENGDDAELRNLIDKFPKYFDRLPRRNVATKVHDDFYLTVFYPFDLAIICPSSQFSIRVTRSSKILNGTDCTFKSLFFEFSPTINDSYLMIVSGLTSNSEEVWGEVFEESSQLSAVRMMFILAVCFIIMGAILSFLKFFL